MEQILQKNVLCYLDDKDKDKRLLYENTKQIDPIDNEFIRNCKFIPDIKKLLEKKDSGENIESELHKYRQTIIILYKDSKIEKKYRNNQRYFFVNSWYDIKYFKELDKVFSPLDWTLKLNKLTFQCLALRDFLIFPFRIINIQEIESPLSYEFDINKLKYIFKNECISSSNI